MKRLFAAVLALALCLALAPAACAEPPSAGDIVTMGTYEQDTDMSNGREPIEWIVLEVRDGKAFLMSRYCLDVVIFYPARVPGFWGVSPLRRWLNTDFISESFTAEEQARIVVTTVENQNPNRVAGAGDATDDRVYFLSKEECLRYMPQMSDRVAYPTLYALSRGCFTDDDTGSCRWWLRTPGARPKDIEGVRVSGQIADYGKQDVDWPDTTMRPVMWVTLE